MPLLVLNCNKLISERSDSLVVAEDKNQSRCWSRTQVVKFDVDKFDGKGNFGLWQALVELCVDSTRSLQNLAGRGRKSCKHEERCLVRHGCEDS